MTAKSGKVFRPILPLFNPSAPNATFLYLLKTSSFLIFSRGREKGALGTNGLNVLPENSIIFVYMGLFFKIKKCLIHKNALFLKIMLRMHV